MDEGNIQDEQTEISNLLKDKFNTESQYLIETRFKTIKRNKIKYEEL